MSQDHQKPRTVLRSDGRDVRRSNPLPSAGAILPRVVIEDGQEVSGWLTPIDNIDINGSPTTYNSGWIDVRNWAGMCVHVTVVSTGTPTNIRLVAQYSKDQLPPVCDFVEGLWASLMWEDVDTADPGISQAYKLPIGGEDWLRFTLIGTGVTDAAYFTVTVECRPYLGPVGMAHA